MAFLWALPLWPGIQIPAIALATELSSQTNIGGMQGLVQTAQSLGRIIGSFLGGVIGDLLKGTENIYNLQPVFYLTSTIPIISAIIAAKIQ